MKHHFLLLYWHQVHLFGMKLGKSPQSAMEPPTWMLYPLDQGLSGLLSKFRHQYQKTSKAGSTSVNDPVARVMLPSSSQSCSTSSHASPVGERLAGSPKQVRVGMWALHVSCG